MSNWNRPLTHYIVFTVACEYVQSAESTSLLMTTRNGATSMDGDINQVIG